MSNSKKYIILYYACFLVTICSYLLLDTKITVFSTSFFSSGAMVLSFILNFIFVVVFSIFLVMKRKLLKVNLAFPILYLLFFGFVLFFSIMYDDRLILSVVHYHYYFMFVLVDYLLLNIYSIISFKKKTK